MADDIIDLTEEPDSPVLQHAHSSSSSSSHPFRTAARSAARSARSARATGVPHASSSRPSRPPRPNAAANAASNPASGSSNVIDLTDVNDDDDDVVIQGSSSRTSNNNSRAERERPNRNSWSIFQQQQHDIQNLMRQQERIAFHQFHQHQQHQQQQQHDDEDYNDARAGAGAGAGSGSGSGSIFGSFGGFGISNVAQLASMAFGGGPAAAAAAVHRRVRSARHQSRSAARAAQHRPARAEAMHNLHNMGNERALLEEIIGGINPLRDNLPDLNYQFNGAHHLFVNAHPHAHIHAHANHPHAAHAHPDARRRNDYPAPPSASAGYTRSTGEDMVAVCAGCDVELAYDPDEPDEKQKSGEPPKKKTTRNRRDLEEHYFWAVTTCGHVFCKSCYENRRNCLKKEKEVVSSSSTSKASAPVVFKASGKAILCAVDKCESDVTAKKAWRIGALVLFVFQHCALLSPNAPSAIDSPRQPGTSAADEGRPENELGAQPPDETATTAARSSTIKELLGGQISHSVVKIRNGDPGLVLLKLGRSTGLTVGVALDMEVITRLSLGDEPVDSLEWPIMHISMKKYDRSRPMANVFSAAGDSGTAIFNLEGRVAGLLTGGTSDDEREFRRLDIAYATPFDLLLKDIEREISFPVHVL